MERGTLKRLAGNYGLPPTLNVLSTFRLSASQVPQHLDWFDYGLADSDAAVPQF